MSDYCDHDYESRYCDRCGGYQGQECNACGDWYDGGDHMAARPEIWCECGPELREAVIRQVLFGGKP